MSVIEFRPHGPIARRVPLRVRIAWHVLRGGPAAYLLGFEAPLTLYPMRDRPIYLGGCHIPSGSVKSSSERTN